MVGMESVDRLFDAVPYTLNQLSRTVETPCMMPIKLRPEGKGSWLTEYRSYSDQTLSAKVLIDWA